MEGTVIQRSKGPVNRSKISEASSLNSIGRNTVLTGNNQLAFSQLDGTCTHPPTQNDEDQVIVRTYPQPPLSSHPFLQSIKPLASSGIFSPPHSLPLVTLPDHTPLSPITQTSSNQLYSPDSVFSPPNPSPSNCHAKQLHRSNVEEWFQTLTPEQEWDTYNPSLTFQDYHQFWESRGLVPLVSTSCSSLDISQTPYSSNAVLNRNISLSLREDNSLQYLPSSVMASINSKPPDVITACSEIDGAITKTKYLMGRLTEEDVDKESVIDGVINKRLDEIRELEISIGCRTQQVIDNFKTELSEDKVIKLNEDVKLLSNAVKTHEKQIRAKVKQVLPPKNLSSYETEMLAIQTKLYELELKKQESNNAAKVQEEKRGKAEVTKKVAAFRLKVRTIEEHIKLVKTREDVDYWANVDSETISRTMKELTTWDTLMKETEAVFIDIENLVKLYGEPEDAADTGYDLAHTKSLLQDLRIDVKNAKDAVHKEDTERALFSLETAKGEILKYPSFSGDSSQDFIKFKEKMVYRFRRNQVAKQDQLDKLREVLKGQALRLVPESTKDIDTAWLILKNAFGDAVRVLQHRLDLLEAMGDLPNDTTEKGFCNMKHKVEFLIKLENTVKDIIDLGNSDEDLMMLAYNGKTVASIVNKFPNSQILKLNRVTGRGKQRLVDIHTKIIEFRSEAQELEKTKSLVTSNKPSQLLLGKKKIGDAADKSTAQVSYNQPKRNPDCRICYHLKEVYKASPMPNTAFFENHLSSYATGCPQFVLMDMSQRFKIIGDVQMCNRCFNPDIIFSRDHIKDCKAKADKNSPFACSKCKLHSWLCKYHKSDNQHKLEKFKKDYRDKFKLKLVFTASISSNNISGNPPMQTDEAVENHSKAQTFNIGSSPTITVQNCSNDRYFSAAAKNMKKRLRSNGFKGDIRPVPEGEPMFLFFKAKGKLNGVNTFFDKGCSTAVFREGIPNTELRGRVIKKGPFVMSGVGGIETKANDLWLTSLDLNDGGKQLVQGLSVDKVTLDFPMFNLELAVKEVKSDNPGDSVLQSCRVPSMAGGCTDLLLGIMYAAIHPVMIHQLPCGLAIYQSKIKSHDGYDCLIGGPHASFDAYATHIGGASQLLVHFAQGLQQFRDWGPPQLEELPYSFEEEQISKQLNVLEGDVPELKSVCHLEEKNELLDDALDYVDIDSEPQIFDIPQLKLTCTCDKLPYCCHNLSQMIESFENSSSDKTRTLKNLLFAQEGGLSIEYRCVKCRSCWECKNSDETEKLSLREEQENQLIKESVKLDFENSIITCTLPGRGSERDFLVSNRDLAVKVFQSVCKRYKEDKKSQELIRASFKKLFDKGFIQLVSELKPEERREFESKEVEYFLPWRPVFTDSATTPCRPTFDASSRTRKRIDGSGGRCLNDYVVKGSVSSLNLLRLVLRWMVGPVALSGDLAQFYNRCKLVTHQWNLQKFIWNENLDPNGELLVGVVKTLIYGVKSVAAQSEFALEELAATVEDTDKELADFLRLCRYVDDLGSSKLSIQACKEITGRADTLFKKVGLDVKGWSYSGENPPEAVTKDGVSINVAGMKWTPSVDALEVRIPKLHFGKRKRGKLDENTVMFDGKFGDLDNFVPKKLSRKQIASKLASIFDMCGKFAPVLIGLKVDLREVVKATESWDEPVSDLLRNKWVSNFWKLEQLRGISFHRPIMPDSAVSPKMRVITCIDASLEAMMFGSWGCFQLKDGSWSCRLIIGRGLLAPSNSTIPKNELDALTGGSNLNWVVSRALTDWIEESIVVGDSMIALSWVTTENKKLSMFHRNRVIAIRRNTELNQLYHVVSENNPADLGTRPSKVSISDVGPNSKWDIGLPWMRGSITDAIENSVVKPALELRLNKDMEEEYSKGLVFENPIPEILTRGHVINQTRLSKLEQLAEFSDYLLLPTKYSLSKIVRIYSMVCSFISKTRKNRKMEGPFLKESSVKFSAFFSLSTSTENGNNRSVPPDESVMVSYFANWMKCDVETQNTFKSFHVDRSMDPINTDKYVNMALLYLFRKATREVHEFNSVNFIKKHTIVLDDILLSKNRMVAGLDFVHTGELNLNLGNLGIKVNAPVIDRYSPLAYSVAQHVHWELAPHKGIETHNRVSLEHVQIIQGMSLFKELSEECILCNMRRKRYIEAEMGGLKSEQFIIAPPFWVSQIDLFGPYQTFVPGFERQTRNRKMLECQVWVLAIVCPTSRLVNLQVVEKTDAGGIICGITRLACEVGMPKYILCDQDSGIMSALSNADLTLRDLELKLYHENEIVFITCPVGGHEQNGQVERVIQSIQQGLDSCGLKQQRIHATGLQTLCKCVENSYNSTPIGYSYSRDVDNTALLKIITPNMLRMGRSNQRQLEGPIRLAQGTRELLNRVEELYKSWFLIWRDTIIPKIMFQPKWYESSKDLNENDIVYFQKKDSALDSNWVIGVIDQVVRSERDNVIRRVIIRYQNKGENVPRFTDRSVRKIVKLFSVDEHHIQEDLAALQKHIDSLKEKEPIHDPIRNTDRSNTQSDPSHRIGANGSDQSRHTDSISCVQNTAFQALVRDTGATQVKSNCSCCCDPHCSFSFHTLSHEALPLMKTSAPCQVEVDPWVLVSLDEEEEVLECESREEDELVCPLLSLDLRF